MTEVTFKTLFLLAQLTPAELNRFLTVYPKLRNLAAPDASTIKTVAAAVSVVCADRPTVMDNLFERAERTWLIGQQLQVFNAKTDPDDDFGLLEEEEMEDYTELSPYTVFFSNKTGTLGFALVVEATDPNDAQMVAWDEIDQTVSEPDDFHVVRISEGAQGE